MCFIFIIVMRDVDQKEEENSNQLLYLYNPLLVFFIFIFFDGINFPTAVNIGGCVHARKYMYIYTVYEHK